MTELRAPEPGEFIAWIVGMPGPDIDYGLCIARDGDRALIRFQVWCQGDWLERWTDVLSETNRMGCWATGRMDQIYPALRAEKERLFGAGKGEA